MTTKPQKAKILLVDDVPANLVALEAVLQQPRYELISVHSGREAVAACEIEEFALIVLDVQMPGMDGYETAKRIKASPRNRETPIVFISAAYTEDPFIKRGFEVGAIDYFGKPFDPEILRTKLGIYADLYLKTHRLRETEELLKTHSQIRLLLNALPVGVIIADAKGRIYEVNEEAARIWGGVRNVGLDEFDEYKGRRPGQSEYLKPHEWAMARALLEGESVKDETIEIETFTGEAKTILNSAYPIRSSAGAILGAVVVIQDITARNEIAKDIEQKTRDLLKEVQLLNRSGAQSI